MLRDTLIGKAALDADYTGNLIYRMELTLHDKYEKQTSAKISLEHETSDDFETIWTALAELFFTRFSSLKLYVIPFTLLPFNTNSLNQGRLNRTSIYQFSFNGTRVTSIITIHLRGPFVYSLVIWVNILLNLLRVFTNNSNCQKQCLEFYRNSCNLWNFVIMLIKLDKIFLGLLLRASLR